VPLFALLLGFGLARRCPPREQMGAKREAFGLVFQIVSELGEE
jgi:hypothetical protein